MAIRVLVLDETLNWADDVAVKKLDGRIFGVYLYLDDRYVRCCEFTPSFEAHFVGDTFDLPEGVWDGLSDEEKEEIDDEIREGSRDTEPVSYFHMHVVETLPERKTNLGPPFFPPGVGWTFVFDDDREGFKNTGYTEEECDEKWLEAALEVALESGIV